MSMGTYDLPSRQNKICLYPFKHLATEVTGYYRLCCISKATKFSIDTMSAREWFEGDYIKSVRERMLNGQEVPECRQCFDEEKIGVQSKRLKLLNSIDPYHIQRLANPKIEDVDWRAGNACNAQCAHCQPIHSTAWAQWVPQLLREGIPFDTRRTKLAYNRPLNEVFDKSEIADLQSVYFAGGEPLIMKQTLESLALLDSKCRVRINTNLSVVRKEFLEHVRRFESTTLICSIDGVGPGFDVLRYPLTFETFERNLIEVLEKTNCDVFLTFALSFLNITEIESVVRFSHRLLEKYGRVSLDFNLVHMPYHLKPTCMSRKLRAKRIRAQRPYLETVKENWIQARPEPDSPTINSILSALDSLETAEREVRPLVGVSKKYLKWLLKRRPSYKRYFDRVGITSDFGLWASIAPNELFTRIRDVSASLR